MALIAVVRVNYKDIMLCFGISVHFVLKQGKKDDHESDVF